MNDRIQVGHHGLPTKESLRTGGISDEPGRVTWSRTFDSSANRQSCDTTGGFDYFQNGVAAAGAEIQRVGCATAPKMLEGSNVRIGQIGNVYVVANGGAIRRR